MGSLQQALPHPLDAETERRFLEILERKMKGAVSMYVDTVRAIQQVYGAEGVEAVCQVWRRQGTDRMTERGRRAEDNGLRAFCAELDAGCRGSHEWVKVEDSDTRQAYRYTRCMWADIFRSLDAADIGKWLCDGDGPAAAAFNPRIRFQRTKTLMEGDDCCDHLFFTEEAT